jgi:hypothetical protein
MGSGLDARTTHAALTWPTLYAAVLGAISLVVKIAKSCDAAAAQYVAQLLSCSVSGNSELFADNLRNMRWIDAEFI